MCTISFNFHISKTDYQMLDAIVSNRLNFRAKNHLHFFRKWDYEETFWFMPISCLVEVLIKVVWTGYWKGNSEIFSLDVIYCHDLWRFALLILGFSFLSLSRIILIKVGVIFTQKNKSREARVVELSFITWHKTCQFWGLFLLLSWFFVTKVTISSR